jgi:hypothetical protein
VRPSAWKKRVRTRIGKQMKLEPNDEQHFYKQWAHRLGLTQSKPLIVTGYTANGTPIIDELALVFHKIPDPP